VPIVPLFGVGTKGRSPEVSAQRRINMYTEQPSDQDKSGSVLYSRPGLSPAIFRNNAAGFGGGPFRGVIVAQRVLSAGLPTQRTVDIVFGAIGANAVVSFNNPDRFLVATDVFQTSSGPMVYADNGTQILGVDGRSAYACDYSVGGFTQTDLAGSVANLPAGATSVCAIASRFVINDPSNKGRFWWSAPLDYTSWSGLDFATAESFPDPLEAVHAFRGELILFGSMTTEFWAPVTDGFARTGGSGVDWGLVSQQTIAEVDGSLFFLGRNAGSDAKVVALRGYQAQPVSTPEVERDINANFTGPVSACVIRKSGATFYVLRTAARTWAMNSATGEWSEWQTGDENFCGKFSFFAYGRQSVTDATTATVYEVDSEAYVDGDVSMVREVTSRHVFHDMERMTVWELRLDVETGASDGSEIMLQVSRDGGRTFGDELWESLGEIGQYLLPVTWKRLGRSRDFVFRFRVTDPVKVVIIGAALRLA
jgi:hypothetical protein